MRVEEVMTKGVSFCNPDTNAAAAAEIMWTQDCGVLPVLENSGRVVGVVTDRDLFIARAHKTAALPSSQWVRSCIGSLPSARRATTSGRP